MATKNLKYTATDLDDSITKFKNNYRDVSSVNVTANDIIEGKIAVSKDQVVIGTLGETTGIVDSNNITNDEASSKVILDIPEDGVYKDAKISASYSQLADTLEINSNAIVEGQSILGIEGTASAGSNVAQGEGISITNENNIATINHGSTGIGEIKEINNSLINAISIDKFGHINAIESINYTPLTQTKILNAINTAITANN